MNIVKFLLDEKIATCQKHAENIIAKLELWKLYNEGQYGLIMTRARLYRDFRNAGENSNEAARKAIAGEPAPAPLIAEAAHSNEFNGDMAQELFDQNLNGFNPYD